MFESLRKLGQKAISAVTTLGAMCLFLLSLLRQSGQIIRRPSLLIQQLYFIGTKTLPIILVSGLFVGMVLGLQFYTNLVSFGGEAQLGLLVALTLVRELGPVLTALLFAGRAGTALCAEIGLMKTTEQLAAMEMMAVNPMRRVIVPRFFAALLSVPLLAAIFSAVGILGAYMVAVGYLGLDKAVYWTAMQPIDFYHDIVNGIIKSVVFALATALIAVYEGYECVPTSQGVSTATTNSVVLASLTVLGLDFVLTSIMFG